MSPANQIGLLGKASVLQVAGGVDNIIPVKCRSWIDLFCLNMKMAQHAVVIFKNVVRQLCKNHLAVLVARIITFDIREHLGEGSGEFDQGAILLGCKIVLDQFLPLDLSMNQLRARRMADETRRSDASVAIPFRDCDTGFAVGIRGVPLVERCFAIGRVSSDVGDLDSHTPAVR